MRFFIVSFVLHLFIGVYFNVFSTSEPIVFEKVGNPDVSFSMVEGSTEPTAPKAIEKPIKKKVVKKKKKVVEQPKKEKKVIEEIKEEVIVVPKKEEKIEEIKEEVVEETIIEDDTEEVEEVIEDVTDSSSEDTSNENSTQQESSSLSSDSFIHLNDGSIVAKNQGVKGLSYGWTNNPDPSYPSIARKMKYDKDVVIKVRFLVGYNGTIEDVKFYDNMTSYGFRAEVEKTLKNWKATPISVDGKKVKLYFYKSFKFEKL